MKNWKQKWMILGVAILIAFAAVWLVKQQRQQAALAEQTDAFNTIEVRRMDLSDRIDATGNVVTEKNAAIYPPYSATVKEILVRPGDSVRKGDILLILQLKDADLINYSSSWKSSLEQAQENLKVAQKALERQQILYKIQGTTIDDLENAQSKVWQHQTEVAEYRQKLDSLDKNGVDKNNNILIRAPFDAEVSWINVKLEETVANTDELLTLGGDRAIRIEAAVDQGDINQVAIGLPAEISANDQNRTIVPGEVISFGSTGTVTSNVVTFPVVIKPLLGSGSDSSLTPPERGVGERRKQRGAIRNGDRGNPPPNSVMKRSRENLKGLLKAGMTVDVTIMVNAHPNVLAIPARAITGQNGDGAIVKVLKQGKFVSRKVRLGYKTADHVEILSGLTEGELVAVPKLQIPDQGRDPGPTMIRMGGGGGGGMRRMGR
ncbi:RND family efflux transporter MFP subunit [Hydrogenispora ethanolica]|uniref:RND family efflux transporter MFP subunit n=1 Tax=Hydrogenispora ethanolica TaxID=1082276 RepID=A0A4R1QXI2_HYDET|nr:HlyD family efflux transporter periplasmic adaptor subunit [Hydrogenispora ethanolica]TCL56504.1 RND family efflux transporter MFP subunit [Hydrogenispora ethanolica]